MKYRSLWPHNESILCKECHSEFRWFTTEERARRWHESTGLAQFKLPCGHYVHLFSDVVPYRGRLVRGYQ